MKNAIEVQRVHHMEGGVDTEPFLSLDYRKETSLRFIFAFMELFKRRGAAAIAEEKSQQFGDNWILGPFSC